jgi:hypothetical protein
VRRVEQRPENLRSGAYVHQQARERADMNHACPLAWQAVASQSSQGFDGSSRVTAACLMKGVCVEGERWGLFVTTLHLLTHTRSRERNGCAERSVRH